MQLALECPVSFMEELLPLTDFDFLLTHLWDKLPGYSEWYLGKKKEDKSRIQVLDNGTNELGVPCGFKEMDDIASLLDPDYIVPPDYLGEGQKTLECLRLGLELWGKERIMPVVQGKDSGEVLQSFRSILEMGFELVSVPYDITVADRKTPLWELADTRKTQIGLMVHESQRLGSGLQIHLLGLNTLAEISYYQGFIPEVISLDTGAPFLNASMGVDFGRDPLVPKGIYIDYDKGKTQYEVDAARLAQKNIQYLKRLMNGSGSV